MYSWIIDVLIWSFAIYGFIHFWREWWLDCVCYIVEKVATFLLFFKKFIAKNNR